MKDGYYLSTFLAYDELCHSLAVKLRHDQNVSLWRKDGECIVLLKYWELERITGFKQHSETFYSKEKIKNLLSFLLQEAGLTLSDINEIWGTTGLEKEKIFYHQGSNISYHSLAHVFSSIFVEGSDLFYKNNILALAVDAAPDNLWEDDAFNKNFYAGAVSRLGKIEYFPVNSPGPLWSHAKKRLGLREGTLMALATASSTHFFREESAYPTILNKDIKNRDAWPELADFIDNLISKAEALSEADTGVLFSGFDPSFTQRENIASMVMKEIQYISNEIMRLNIEALLKKSRIDPKETYLAISGGFGLNCPANSFLLNYFGFKGFLAPPCINDAGISLGQALYYFYYNTPERIQIARLSPYLGREFLAAFSSNYDRYIESTSGFDGTVFLQDITEAPVVWFNGRSEIGPRSLGNRSILSDPRTLKMKSALNTIKKREWWRPVAPVALEEKMEVCFNVRKRSPFMLELIDVKQDMQEKIPAVCHLDTTARIQTLAENDNPLLHKAISDFFAATGIPLLCNTSLNDNNEPIIDSPDEALNFCLRKGIKVIYLNGKRFRLHRHDEFEEIVPKQRNSSFSVPMQQADPMLNPFNLSKDELTCFWDYKHIFGENGLKDPLKVEQIKKKTADLTKRFGYLAR